MTHHRRNRLPIGISLFAVLVLSVSLVLTATTPVEADGSFDLSEGSIDDDEGYVGDEIRIYGDWDSEHGDEMYVFFELFAEDEEDWPMDSEGYDDEGADYYAFDYDFEIPECCSGMHEILICDDNDPNDDVDTLEFTIYPFIELDEEEGIAGAEVEVTGHGWDENESEISIRFFNATGEPDPAELDDPSYYTLVVNQAVIEMEEDDERYGMWATTVTFNVPSAIQGVHYVYAVGDVNYDIEDDNIKPAQFNVVTDPTIAVSESSFDFSATVGGDDPDDATLEIWNSGPGTITWSVDVESDEDWLELDPLDGTSTGEHDDITLSIDISDLDAGAYEATISIEAPEADNSPETVSVDLEVEEEEEEPTIDFSPSSLDFTADEGGGDPQGQTLRIWNSGEGTLDWSVESDEDWLSLDPDEGTSTGQKRTVGVSVDISGLDEGEYEAEITIRDPDASEKTEKVEVTLKVSGASASGLYTLTTRASPSNGGTVGLNVPQPSGGYADGTAVQLTATPSPGYVFSSWSGGVLGSDNPATVTMSFNLNIVANFVLFNIGALPNVELVSLSPQVVSITVASYPAQGLGEMAGGFTVERAYVVTPQGSGSFTLRFTGIPDPANVKVYKVGDGFWTLLPTTVAGDSAIDVTMEVVDPIIVLASAQPSGSQSLSGRISAFFGKISGSGGDLDTPVIVAIVIIGALVAGAVVVFVLLAKRR